MDRFRYDEPQARPERDSISSDFWWLHGTKPIIKNFIFIFFSNLDELKTTFETVDEDDERKSNIPEFIEVNFSLEKNYEIIKKLIFIDISFDRY